MAFGPQVWLFHLLLFCFFLFIIKNRSAGVHVHRPYALSLPHSFFSFFWSVAGEGRCSGLRVGAARVGELDRRAARHLALASHVGTVRAPSALAEKDGHCDARLESDGRFSRNLDLRFPTGTCELFVSQVIVSPD